MIFVVKACDRIANEKYTHKTEQTLLAKKIHLRKLNQHDFDFYLDLFTLLPLFYGQSGMSKRKTNITALVKIFLK